METKLLFVKDVVLRLESREQNRLSSCKDLLTKRLQRSFIPELFLREDLEQEGFSLDDEVFEEVEIHLAVDLHSAFYLESGLPGS